MFWEKNENSSVKFFTLPSGGSKPDKSFYILSIISVYGVFSYYAFQLIKTSIIAKQKYLFKPYDFNQPYSNNNSMVINQTVLEVNYGF